jgi:hypothetical protein
MATQKRFSSEMSCHNMQLEYFIILGRMIFFEIELLSFYMCKSSNCIKLYDFIIVVNLSFPCLVIPLGGGAPFL